MEIKEREENVEGLINDWEEERDAVARERERKGEEKEESDLLCPEML